MARKSQYRLGEKGAEVSELLDSVEHLLERTKVLYEQYFMGIQKMAPAQLHRDVERKIRELTQFQIRNTALRYRLTTVTQKFGVYNSYWRRTMRQIEQGKYVRDIARVSRRAQERGVDVPDELLRSMPKRMRDRIVRDRELLARRTAEGSGPAEIVAEGEAREDESTQVFTREETPAPRSNVHQVDAGMLDDDLGVDVDELFRSLTSEAEKAVDAHTRPAPARPAAVQPAAPARPAATASARPAPQPPPRPAATPPPIPKAGTARATPPPIPTAGSGRATPRPAPAQAAASPPVARPQPAPASALPAGMNEATARDLHKRYLQARRSVGESADVPYEKLMQSLRNQAPRIMQQHKASSVEFDVVVKNDKVLLKAKPKP